MTPFEWIQLAVQVIVLGAAVAIIRGDSAKFHSKLDKMASLLTDMRLELKDCVTWEELSRELGPIRTRGDDHEKRIGVIETKCEARHGGGK